MLPGLRMVSCKYTNGNGQPVSGGTSLPHDSTRLEMFKRLAQIRQLTPRCITFSGLLREEATLQKNDRYNTIAAYLHTVYYYNQNNRDSVKKWLDTMEPYARKSQTWDLYFDALRFQIDLCTYEEQYELAINEANLMYERAQKVNCARGLIGAKQCLGNVYISTERWDEGMKALEAAYQLSLQTDNAVVRISILCQLISITKDQKTPITLRIPCEAKRNTASPYLHEPDAQRGIL